MTMTSVPDRMRRHHLDIEQVLQEARQSQGIRSADEIDYAILERSGTISVIRNKD
ncbi:YetF domain-containing protein [Thermopolyspora sp. NPDC052614]|uniref:YetF domain-containing protein n=1 Tax=Thermopolyspora sp. NPDC052614 TaxID=3155682 RepID=UPI00344AB7DF